MAARASFITETVFSPASKVDLVTEARALGYLVHLHVVMVSESLSVARVAASVAEGGAGGHNVSEHKVRERYARPWPLIATARDVARATFYDNSRATRPFVVVATYDRGRLIGEANWPRWAPGVLLA